MGREIFSDIDANVSMRPTQQGLEVSAPCQFCQRRRIVLHPWRELQAVLSGQPVQGYQQTYGGWIHTVPCSESCIIQVQGQHRRGTIQYKLARQELLNYMSP
jgi:hypothetical protein